MTSVVLDARLPKRASECSQAFLPFDDGALSAIKLLLLSKEVFLQLDGHCRQGMRGPMPKNKQRLMS
jgi:hypothetical protein